MNPLQVPGSYSEPLMTTLVSSLSTAPTPPLDYFRTNPTHCPSLPINILGCIKVKGSTPLFEIKEWLFRKEEKFFEAQT